LKKYKVLQRDIASF